MDENKLLGKIGKLIDKKLLPINKHLGIFDERFGGINKRLDSVDKRLDSVDKRFGGINKRLDSVDNRLATLDLKIEALNVKIDKSQKETIETLSDLIQTGYEMHERRIKRLEEHSNLP